MNNYPKELEVDVELMRDLESLLAAGNRNLSGLQRTLERSKRRHISNAKSQANPKMRPQVHPKMSLQAKQVLHRKRERGPSSTGNSTALSKGDERRECFRRFGERRFFFENERRLPPILYTFPGSGNTWCRLLIEHATGILTGSFYNDKTLISALPGEYSCSWRVSAVKVHPHTHGFHTGENPFGNGHYFKTDNDKCLRGNVKEFKRAILLIRDPYDSIWSEYQRRMSRSHVAGIPIQAFKWPNWMANAANLANRYREMWGHYNAIMEKFGEANVLFVKYEDLKNNETRIDAMRRITDFLYVPTTNERLKCAFLLSESTRAHRTVPSSSTAEMMSKSKAYTKDLTCEMWESFGQHAAKHGYRVFNDYLCEGYLPIKDIEVGPHGEFKGVWRNGMPRAGPEVGKRRKPGYKVELGVTRY